MEGIGLFGVRLVVRMFRRQIMRSATDRGWWQEWLPVSVRAEIVCELARRWIKLAQVRDGDTLSLLEQAAVLYARIRNLGLPTPEPQYKSESSRHSLGRTVANLNAMCALAEDDRFSKRLLEDTKEFLEVVCADQRTKYLFQRAAAFTRDGMKADRLSPNFARSEPVSPETP